MVICFVSVPLWWIAARWTCANSRTPFVHGGSFCVPRPNLAGNWMGLFFTRSHDSSPSPNARVGGWYHRAGCGEAILRWELTPSPTTSALARFPQSCSCHSMRLVRPLPSLTGTGPVQHVALTQGATKSTSTYRQC